MFSSCIFRLSCGVAIAVWFCLLVCSFALPAHAYVDPGTGLFVFQMLTTTLAGITYMLRRRIRELFERFSGASKKDSDDVAGR